MDDVFKEYSEKNHTELPALTIIQGGGTVKREESDRNLMYDESNLSNYKMVRKNDFIVHLRSFEGGLEKSSLDGIISPAYHTFHSDVADSRFYYSYFRSHEFIKHKLVPHVYGIDEVKQYIAELRNGNPKMADIMSNLVSEIEVDADRYKGHSILNIVETTKQKYIENRISDFCEKWYAEPDDVMYAAMHYRNDEIPNEGVIKATIDYTCYKANAEKAVPKFKYYKMCMDELKEVLDTEIKPLINPL